MMRRKPKVFDRGLTLSVFDIPAHMNLRDEFLPYRYLIGQVMLDVSLAPCIRADCLMDETGRTELTRMVRCAQKNSGLRTVVNKLDSIDTEFRVFKMEVLAGDDDFVTEMVRALPPRSALSGT
jgi:tRNA (guanine37-N1)-methyltransferase